MYDIVCAFKQMSIFPSYCNKIAIPLGKLILLHHPFPVFSFQTQIQVSKWAVLMALDPHLPTHESMDQLVPVNVTEVSKEQNH